MRKNNNDNDNSFKYFVWALQILFIGLKLTGFIEWNWLWVLFPLWLPITFVAVVFVLFVIVRLIIKKWKEK